MLNTLQLVHIELSNMCVDQTQFCLSISSKYNLLILNNNKFAINGISGLIFNNKLLIDKSKFNYIDYGSVTTKEMIPLMRRINFDYRYLNSSYDFNKFILHQFIDKTTNEEFELLFNNHFIAETTGDILYAVAEKSNNRRTQTCKYEDYVLFVSTKLFSEKKYAKLISYITKYLFPLFVNKDISIRIISSKKIHDMCYNTDLKFEPGNISDVQACLNNVPNLLNFEYDEDSNEVPNYPGILVSQYPSIYQRQSNNLSQNNSVNYYSLPIY